MLTVNLTVGHAAKAAHRTLPPGPSSAYLPARSEGGDKRRKLSMAGMARGMRMSRSQFNRLLDPEHDSLATQYISEQNDY